MELEHFLKLPLWELFSKCCAFSDSGHCRHAQNTAKDFHHYLKNINRSQVAASKCYSLTQIHLCSLLYCQSVSPSRSAMVCKLCCKTHRRIPHVSTHAHTHTPAHAGFICHATWHLQGGLFWERESYTFPLFLSHISVLPPHLQPSSLIYSCVPSLPPLINPYSRWPLISNYTYCMFKPKSSL